MWRECIRKNVMAFSFVFVFTVTSYIYGVIYGIRSDLWSVLF